MQITRASARSAPGRRHADFRNQRLPYTRMMFTFAASALITAMGVIEKAGTNGTGVSALSCGGRPGI